MIDDLFKHRAERQTIMSTESRGETKDRDVVCESWRLEILFRALDGRVEMRENTSVPA